MATALCLAREDAGKSQLSADTILAFDRVWALQIQEGDARGGWAWFALELDAWEMPDSAFYGASMAALAVGNTPAAYRARPENRARIAALSGYLTRVVGTQPLHNRLAQLWASSRLADAMPPSTRKSTIAEAWRQQQPDGSWTIESLGPFRDHPAAQPSNGNRAYATAWFAWTLEQGGVSPKDPKLARALAWLRANQDQSGGYWDGQSMNKAYPADSMQIDTLCSRCRDRIRRTCSAGS